MDRACRLGRLDGVRLIADDGGDASDAGITMPRVFAHIGFEVHDLARSARFYDAVFFPLGCRRQFEAPGAVAYGRLDARFWIVQRGRTPAPGYGHVALEAVGRAAVDAAHAAGLAAGGRDDGAPGPRPRYGPRYYAGYLTDPDGYRVEIVSGQE